MNFTLKYGLTNIKIDLPDGRQNLIIEPKQHLPEKDEQKVILNALDKPINSQCLEKIVRKGEKTVIVIPDRTRSCRTAVYLPILIDRLNKCGISDSDIYILIANGTHSLCSKQDVLFLVGKDIYSRVNVLNHDCRDVSALIHVGQTKRGTQVYLNKNLVKAERVILTGGILHHYFAGYGGGPKLVMPGCAGLETILQNHSYTIHPEFHSLHPGCSDGNIVNNPVQEDLRESLKFVRIDFSLHIVMDFEGKIFEATAGELFAGYHRACERVDQLYRLPIKTPADLVIVSCGGYPKDLNLVQAHKSIHHGFYALKKNGVMIVLAQCVDGIGSSTFMEWFEEKTIEGMHRALLKNFKINGNTALALKIKANQAKIIFVSDLEPEIVRKTDMLPARDFEEAYQLALKFLPESFDTITIPNASLTLPYLEESIAEFRAHQGETLINKTMEYVKIRQQDNTSGHDWWHTWRVWKMAKRLAEKEKADPLIVELAALLHDIADWKYVDDHQRTGHDVARDWLTLQKVPLNMVDRICEIIDTLSFKGAGVVTKMKTIEGQIVQDADRLDAIGSIGIARAFAYGGSRQRPLHIPEIEPVYHKTADEYKSWTGTTISHFYEKLLLLKDRMNTLTAKKIAEGRHKFLENYLDRFFKEWDGEL